MKYDGLILDVDGTIWNTTEVVAEAWNKAIEENFPQVKKVSAEILQGQFGKPMNVIADNLFTVLSAEEKKILLEKCCKYEQQAVETNQKNITYEGVVETVKKISSWIPVFVVSNCHKGYIELVLEKNGLKKFVKDFECFGNNGFTKDKNILVVKERNFLKNPVYVGDTQGDADSCKKAVVDFIWAEYGFGKVQKSDYCAKINCFSELLDLLNP